MGAASLPLALELRAALARGHGAAPRGARAPGDLPRGGARQERARLRAAGLRGARVSRVPWLRGAWRVASHAFAAARAATSTWWGSRASGAGCARRARRGGRWTRRRTWWTRCCPRYRCGSGCCRCPSRCAGCWRVGRRWWGGCSRCSCGRCRRGSGGVAGSLGVEGATGTVTFVQRFGSALQLTIHFHAVVPDGVFVRGDDGAVSFRAPAGAQRRGRRALAASARPRACCAC